MSLATRVLPSQNGVLLSQKTEVKNTKIHDSWQAKSFALPKVAL